MRIIPIILLAITLVACGESPAPAAPKERLSCFIVQILNVEEGTTLLEINGEEPRNRILRSGKFGNVGDRFTFCE